MSEDRHMICLINTLQYSYWLMKSTVQSEKQKLSYRKRIARQLRTQYIKGIHRPKYYTVTLKSRLKVTQDHCKWNHWTDHARLTVSRVI